MAASLKLDYIKNATTNAIDVRAMADTRSYYYRQTLTLVDTTARTSSTTWTAGASWGPYTGFKAGSLLRISYMVPARNDQAGWGGLYFEPQVSFNSGTTWYSLGSRGYDAVMISSYADINGTSNTMQIDPGMTADFPFSIRYYFKAYDGTVGINNGINHDLNIVSGTANGGIISGDNGNQHYVHFIVEELALFKG